ncbi:MAG: hypothetical protein DME26_08675 [Verrucomicrobia bacterium]|nr:MAG: hypothetical protein DME26_08675 [Verrucomicrobiota bacterium]
MNPEDSRGGKDPISMTKSDPIRPFATPVAAGLLSWVAISLGFLGLKFLMQERPEFVGQPMRAAKAELIQESPRIVMRRVTDDISVIKPIQPEFADVRFDMNGRRDYRGLKTIVDMSGDFRARYVFTNLFEEPSFLLFKCPHPRPQNADNPNLLAGGLKLQSSANGVQENTKEAWFWSGTLEPRSSVTVDISYHVASLKGVTYSVGEQNGNPVKQLRITFHRKDLASMRFESGDGPKQTLEETVVWEQKDFLAPNSFSAEIVESRNLYVSLAQLVEIGPLVCLLFLLAVSALILVRQHLTAIQMFTIAAGYALYFPLILYLSSRFSFAVALIIAVVVPGALLVNYARWLLGTKLGLLGVVVLLGLYQVFPTLAAFAGWNRGMVLLCLGVVTLWVLINLQNQALRRQAAAAAFIVLSAFTGSVSGAEIQVVLPGELAGKLLEQKRDTTNALVAYEPAQYEVRHEQQYFRVEARVSFHVLRPGEIPVPLFGVPVHLQESKCESAEPELARLVTLTNRLGLFVQRAGQGTLRLSYRVPSESREAKKRAQIPLLISPAGHVRLESHRNDLEIVTGSVWVKSTVDKMTAYDIGVAGTDLLVVEWRDQGSDSMTGLAKATEGTKAFYGIGLTHAQNLTVINSDGSCTHFAEFELPAFQSDEFRLRLPVRARLISVSVNGTELSSPAVEDQLCRLRLPSRQAQQTVHRLSFRIAYPTMRLGFVGLAELTLPELRNAGHFQRLGDTEVSARFEPIWRLWTHREIPCAHVLCEGPGTPRIGQPEFEVSSTGPRHVRASPAMTRRCIVAEE